MRPYYERDGVTLYHGDCREVLPLLETASVDLVLTDPPYNAINRETGGLRTIDKGRADSATVDVYWCADEFYRLTSGSVYVWCSDEQYTGWTNAFKSLGSTTRKCAWWKTNPSPMNGERLWLSAVELCVFARKPGAYFGKYCEAPVWKGPHESVTDHPTEKPLWLFNRLIGASCITGGMVLDPYCGSGTTLRAAKDAGCRAIGIELEERYCEIAARRLEQGILPGLYGEPIG